jgi:proteasome alpha subunit
VSMPFYVSPEQQMRDKANYAQQGVSRGRSCVALQYADGILMVAPNASNALHKISEIYDRIAFAAVGRYTEYETLRKAGVTYADLTGFRYDRSDVLARSIANYYAQNLDQIFTQSIKPYEVELVVAEVGTRPDNDQIYRITFDGSVSEERGFVAFGGDAGKVSAVLKERYSEGMSLAEAFAVALAGLSALAPAPTASSSAASSSSASSSSASSGSSGSSSAAAGNGNAELTASQLEVAFLDRSRDHRKFRRIRAARLDDLLAEARAQAATPEPDAGPEATGTEGGGTAQDSTDEPPTGPAAP